MGGGRERSQRPPRPCPARRPAPRRPARRAGCGRRLTRRRHLSPRSRGRWLGGAAWCVCDVVGAWGVRAVRRPNVRVSETHAFFVSPLHFPLIKQMLLARASHAAWRPARWRVVIAARPGLAAVAEAGRGRRGVGVGGAAGLAASGRQPGGGLPADVAAAQVCERAVRCTHSAPCTHGRLDACVCACEGEVHARAARTHARLNSS